MNLIPDTKPAAKSLNRPAYIVFVLAGIGFLMGKDFSQAVIFMGLALVFDPFNPQQPFQKRPFYQKAWLLIHLSITLILFCIDIMQGAGK